MVRLLIWLVLAFIVGRMIWRFVYAVMEGAGMLKDQSSPAAVKLVRDPVCGVFVVPQHALTAGSGAATRYLCSEKCRSAWSGR